MTETESREGSRQHNRFLYLYALAAAGGAIAYVPFLTILLPNRAATLAPDDPLTLLAHIAFAGAVSASIANILFGWVSDRSGVRRPWIAAGMLLSSALLPAMQFAHDPASLIMLIICWQFALNMMLSPLTAWAGDYVPDQQKGLLGGLLAFAPALGALAGAVVTWPNFAAPGERLVLVAMLVIVMVAPALLFGSPKPMPELMEMPHAALKDGDDANGNRAPVVRMWLARLFVQIAEASLFAFLLLWFRSIAPEFDDNDAASIFAIVLAVAVACTLVVGRWSDRTDRPILPLALCASIAAAGLLMMAMAQGLALAIAGYVAFGLFSSIFLALHSSQTLRVLPAPRNRGRDLGLFNLTNTGPSLIMPWLTLAMVPVYGFDALFLLLAGLAVLAALMLFTMPRRLNG
jgi:MFS family permease